MKFRQNLAVKILSVMAAVSVLASCGSAPSKVSSKIILAYRVLRQETILKNLGQSIMDVVINKLF